MYITLESVSGTRIKQWGYTFLLKETMGSVDRAWTHDWQASDELVDF